VTSFDDALEFALEWETGGDPEGGYTNDPVDRGGETRFGISKTAHPNVDIEHLSRGEAAEIYRREYWAKTGDRIRRLDCPALDLALFDFAVNSGSRRAVRELQQLVGATPDGDLGAKTVEAVRVHALNVMAAALADRRRQYLEHLVLVNSRYKRFERGWLRRVAALKDAIVWGEKP
jgi:lysozyme family protein